MLTRQVRRLIVVFMMIILSAAVAGINPQAQVTNTWTYLHTSGRNIVDANGNVVHISGVNWFGAETPDYAPDGLWSINYKTMLNQIKSLGYNTIRLPFSTDFLDFKDTNTGYVPNLSLYANPELADPADPSGQTPLKGMPLLDKIINYAGSIGLRVFLDRHRAQASTQSALWYIPGSSKHTEARWISDWQWLATHYLNNPTVIGGDLHNEPHSIQGNPSLSACWGCGDPGRDWKLAAQRAGNAILAANPNWLIIVEGTDTNPVTGATTWWGGDLSNAGNDPVVLNIPNRVVYSPHEYPASIYAQTWFSDPNYPNNMPAIWESHWGYLDTQNIAPVLIGEFGSYLATTSDQQWFNKLTIGTGGNGYIKSKSLNWTFWSWNPNSGDTGGLLEYDWVTVVQAKQNILAQIQYPFIGSPGGNTATNTPTNTQPPTFQPITNTPTTTRTPTRTNTPVGTPTRTNTPTNTPIVTASRTHTPTGTPTTGTPGALKVQIQNGGTDGSQQSQFNFKVVNTGSAAQSNVSVRVYIQLDGSQPISKYVIEKYWDQSGVATVSGPTLTSGTTYYYTISFGTASLAAGGSWQYNAALHLSDWSSNFNAGNDFWHTGYAVRALPSAFADTTRIPAYTGSTLVWGTTP